LLFFGQIEFSPVADELLIVALNAIGQCDSRTVRLPIAESRRPQ